jgi:hypothetical protein
MMEARMFARHNELPGTRTGGGRVRRRVALAVVVTVLAAGVAYATAAVGRTAGATGRSAATAPQTLVLVAKRQVMTLPSAPTVGVTFVAGGDLFNEAGATKLGDAYSQCSVAKLDAATLTTTATCATTLRLEHGEILLGGLRVYSSGHFNDTTMAILGGTGDYSTARGEATTHLVDPVNTTYKFTVNIQA